MGQRLKSRCLLDLAYQVALIRPGVGVQGSAVAQFVERYRHGAPWDYDHPLERRALERGCGIIVWQEQVVQLVMDVAGLTAAQADEMRRAFARPNNKHLIEEHWQRFREGARERGVPDEAAAKIFAKLNGQYMFPESHSHAFAVTRLSGRVAEAVPPGGVLCLSDEQPAYGFLSQGNAETGRPPLRGALPESLRQPQPGTLPPRGGFRFGWGWSSSRT